MNESSPIRRETAREYPAHEAPVTMPARRRGRIGRWLLLLLVLAGGGAAGYRYYLARTAAPTETAQSRGTGGPGRGGKHAEPPQAVGMATVAAGDMPVVLQGLGTVTPLATTTIRSQISGYLMEIAYREGQMVKKGDFLVQIDQRPYEALLAQYQGQLARDQALLQNSRLDLTRFQRLSQQDSISKQNVDTQAALVKQNEGTVASDQALVDQQRLNIAYAHIVSPIDGRVGLRQVDLGNYITAASTSIVVVTQLHPISVVFTLPEDDVARVMRRVREGAKLTVRAYDRGDQHEIAVGTLDTVDNQIDTTTGTVKLRALFQNGDETLFPNQFVNARLTVDTVRDVPLVPNAAILRGTPGTYVYVMDGEDKVAVRPIRIGQTDGTRTVALSGLAVGDRVVTDGTDRLREGAPVRITGGGAPRTAPPAGEGKPVPADQAKVEPAPTPAAAKPADGAPETTGSGTETSETPRRRGRDRHKATTP